MHLQAAFLFAKEIGKFFALTALDLYLFKKSQISWNCPLKDGKNTKYMRGNIVRTFVGAVRNKARRGPRFHLKPFTTTLSLFITT
jgi:hypothetical protein